MQRIIGKHWHHLPDEELEVLLDTSRLSGLDLFEIEHRTLRFGPNVIPAKKKTSAIVLFLKQFHQPLVYILLAAGLVTALLSEVVDASVIFGVVLVNALIGFIQEANAVKAIEALSRAMVADATVIRAGETRKISSPGVVPGDVVVLQAGDKVPADVRLFAVKDLQVDESALTGESVPVEKKTGALPPGTLLPERANMAYASTMVTYGQGRGIVVATGEATEVGVISRLVSSVPLLETPLTRRISSFSRILLYAILAMAAVTFAVGYLRGEPAMDMFMAAVALAVGAIPEGLPAALTITLAIGVSRMAKKRAVIRSLPAVETLGSTTVICSDKTGTLTENRMTVQELLAGERQYTVTGTGYGFEGEVREEGRAVSPGPALRELHTAGVLCNDSSLAMGGDGPVLQGDPTEGALIAAAAKAGVDKKDVEQRFPRLDSIPFQSEYQYMATLHRDPGSGRLVVYAKGAAEKLLAMCSACIGEEGTPEPLDRETVMWIVRDMAQRGLRVLGFARFEHGEGDDRLQQGSLAGDGLFLGLQAMIDPPRTESAEAVAKCRRAGITVKMITGDHPLTARAIALKIGIIDDGVDGGTALSGAEMAALSDRQFIEEAHRVNVFARVTPEQKLRLVEAIQSRGDVVAMTGDGVNDAPALKRADIGIAMGVSGTEAAKEAADMVLTDDNFATIERAVEEGRGVFDNLKKFIVWTLPTNIGEGLVILVAVFTGALLPILPVQILWINMTTAVLLGLMLAFEPKEYDIMARRPRDPREPLLTTNLVVRIVLVGLVLLAGAFGLFEQHLWAGGVRSASKTCCAEARTVAVTVFIVVEAFYLFNCRSFDKGLLRIGFFSNPWVWGGTAIMLLLQAAFIYLPFMNRVFHSAPISLLDWAKIVAVGAGAYVIVSIEKAVTRRVNREKDRPSPGNAGGS